MLVTVLVGLLCLVVGAVLGYKEGAKAAAAAMQAASAVDQAAKDLKKV